MDDRDALPGSNSFDYIPVRELQGFMLDVSCCTARELGLSRAATSRAVIVAVDARFVLCRTDTGDFSDAQVRLVVHQRGQLYLDVSGKPAITDFGRDVRQVVVSPTCRSCPDLATCCACYVPTFAWFFEDDEKVLEDWLRARRGRLLDVGMGFAPYREAMSDAILGGRLEYHGLDPDPAVIAAAGASGLPMSLHEVAIEAFVGCEGFFDAAVALRSLNHFQDVDCALDVIARCLRPGAEVLMIESLPLPLVRSRRHASLCHVEAAGGHAHLRNWDSSQVVARLPGRPFSVVQERPVGRDTCDQWILRLRRD
jgi:SAM-dependent methyltransferase